MHTRRSLTLGLAAAMTVLATIAPMTAAAATTGVECGAINAYTAPDPVGPTDGSIQFGFSGPTETILAAATMDPAVLANLPGQTGNGAITCLSVTADGSGDITGLAYATDGQISGPIAFDAIQDAYIVADRIFVPTSQLIAQPELVPVVQVPYEAGEPLTVSLTVDTSSGNPGAISTASDISGPVSFSGGGDLLIDGATLPAAYVTGNALRALQVADGTGSDVDLDIAGAIDTDTGNFLISLGVDTIGCTTVDARSAGSITLDGVTFALGAGSTAAASLTTGVEVGVRVTVETDGALAITEVSLAGCGAVAPIAPPETDTDTSEPMTALWDFAVVGLIVTMLAGWYGAAFALKRRPTRDR